MTISDIGAFYNASNVLVGSAAGFVAPVGTADPADSLIVFDATTWIAPWVSCGATEQGWQVNWNPSTQNYFIDEQQTPVDQGMTEAVLSFVANLSEDTILSWGYALNADKTVIAPTVPLYGKTKLTPGRALKRFKVVLETQSALSYPVRWIVNEMVCAAQVGTSFRRAAGQRLIPVTFTSVCPLSGIQRVEITANHS